MTDKKKKVNFKQKESSEFLERKELIRLQAEADEKKFQNLIFLEEYKRESRRIEHEQELERGRIKTEEIRKTQFLKRRGY